MKSNQSYMYTHTTLQVVHHGRTFAKIVFRVINNYPKICFTAFGIAEHISESHENASFNMQIPS